MGAVLRRGGIEFGSHTIELVAAIASSSFGELKLLDIVG